MIVLHYYSIDKILKINIILYTKSNYDSALNYYFPTEVQRSWHRYLITIKYVKLNCDLVFIFPYIGISWYIMFIIYDCYIIMFQGIYLEQNKCRLLGLLTISDHIKSTVIIIICFALTIRCLYTNYIYTWFEIFSQYFTWKNSKFIILIAKFHFT